MFHGHGLIMGCSGLGIQGRSPEVPNLQQRPVSRHRFRPAVAAQHQVFQLEVAIGHALHRAAQRSLA